MSFRMLRRAAGRRFTASLSPDALNAEVQRSKLVIIGEDHEQPPVVALQCAILQSMHESALAARPAKRQARGVGSAAVTGFGSDGVQQ